MSRSSCPRRDSLTEGDGWILALTYDVVHDRSELVIIDAEDFAARPVATVQLPRRVPPASTAPGSPRRARGMRRASCGVSPSGPCR